MLFPSFHYGYEENSNKQNLEQKQIQTLFLNYLGHNPVLINYIISFSLFEME